MMKKNWIKSSMDLPDDLFNGSIDEVVDRLKDVEDKLSREGKRNVLLKWHSDYDYQVVMAIFERPETDEELEKRRKKIENRIKRMEKEEAERKDTIESLKKELDE